MLEDKLYAYIYKELDAKKGGNNVTLILLYHLVNQFINNFCSALQIEESNLVMDTYKWKNKNGTVLKMGS